MGRISIARVLGFVAVLAVGLAAVCRGGSYWGSLILLMTMIFLFSAILGAIFKRGHRGPWVGFALFGWGYILLGYQPIMGADISHLWNVLTDLAFESANPAPVAPGSVPQIPNPEVLKEAGIAPVAPGSVLQLPIPRVPTEAGIAPVETALMSMPPAPDFGEVIAFETTSYLYNARRDYSRSIGHWLFTLAFAWIGSILGEFLSRTPGPTSSARTDPPGPR